MVQAEESSLANHWTGDMSIQNVAGNPEMVTHNTCESMVFGLELK
jgi:hypothetical protein